MEVHTILYVENQTKSRDFYRSVFDLEPSLDVPGMTMFKISDHHTIGLMPNAGIMKLLGDKITNPKFEKGSPPKAELYIIVDRPEDMFKRAIEAGAIELSPIQERNWGDTAGYVMDADGNIIAIATTSKD